DTPTAPAAGRADKNKDAEKNKPPEKEPTDEAPAEAAPVEPHERAPAGMINHEFRSDKWTELYIKRIDDFIAVLKAKNVPVFWVGLPPVRNAKTSGDLSYLNDLYRSRAEKAAIPYIDTPDAFVDDQARFLVQQPHF